MKGWMSGREKERRGLEKGTEEEQRRRKSGNMRRFLLDNDKRKQRQEGTGVKDEG